MRKFTFVFSLLLMTLLSFQTVNAQTGSLLAIKGSEFSIAAYNGNVAANAYDGNVETIYWSNGAAVAGSTFQLNLADVATVNEIKLVFAAGDRTKAADVEISSDGSEWTKVGGFTNGTELSEYTCNANGKRARYVRLKIVEANGGSWFKLCEFQVYGVICPAYDDEAYIPNYTGTKGGDRPLNSISLNGSTWGDYSLSLTNDEKLKLYVNATSTTEFTVSINEEITPVVAYGGSWMHAYVYIDADENGFYASTDEDGDGYTPLEDLVSYSTYNPAPNNGGKWLNSKGNEVGNNTVNLPSFNAPATPGVYRMRYKIDWNSIDPAGCSDASNRLDNNRGSIVDVILNVVVPVEVTYNVLFNGKVKATQTVNTYIGANYPDVTVGLPFGVSANKPEGEILLSDATEVDGVYTITNDLDAVVSLPFKYADSVGNIKNWYYIQMHSSSGYGKYLQYHEGNYIEWTDGTRTVGEEDSYSWAFVGNPFDGLKLVNRYAPAEANAVTSAKDSGNPGFGPIDGATAWNIKASRTNKDNEHFCFQYPGSSNYMNAQSGKVAFWGDNDQGSTMWVTERDLTMTTELQALIGQVEAAIAAYGEGGTTVGYYTAASVDNLLAALAAAKTAVADPDRTLDTNRAAMTNLQAAVAALKTIQPEENVLYTIQNVYSGVYMNVTKTGGTVKSGDATAYELFKFVSAGDGKYYLYNVTRNKYLSSAPKHGYGQVLFAAETTAEAKAVTIANLGKANQVSIVPDGGATVHHDQNYGTIVGWNGGIDGRSAWVIAATGLSTAKMTVLTELVSFCSEKDDILDKVGEGYGYYSGNDEALLAALSPELYSKTVAELAEMTDDAVAAAGTAAVNAVTEAANTFSVNVPAANCYVRIAYDFGGDTLYVQGEKSNVSGKVNSPIMTAATDAASIFYFGDSTLLSYKEGLYLKEDGGTRGLQAMNAAAGEASFEAGSVLGTLAVKVPAYMHVNTSGDVRFIDHCSGKGNPVHTAHNMIVEAVTELPVTVTAAGYASFYAPVALEIPEGVEVFYATQVNGDYVSLVKIESGKIPAETGVIIKAAEGIYNFAITDEEVPAIDGNIFLGTVNKQVVAKGTSSCYVLGIVGGNVGMYNAVNGSDETTFINAGHKAYMCLVGGAGSAGYRFDFDGTTGITEVETENADDAVIYDLTGRRVQDMNRAGIYIVNGKKVLVK